MLDGTLGTHPDGAEDLVVVGLAHPLLRGHERPRAPVHLDRVREHHVEFEDHAVLLQWKVVEAQPRHVVRLEEFVEVGGAQLLGVGLERRVIPLAAPAAGRAIPALACARQLAAELALAERLRGQRRQEEVVLVVVWILPAGDAASTAAAAAVVRRVEGDGLRGGAPVPVAPGP